MNIKITYKFIASFTALLFLMNEAHELTHTTIGRIICGCWGQRDFNVWGLCDGCLAENPYALAATFAGPVFTFSMIWIGAFYMGEHKTIRQKSFGFALLFANMPFAQLFQPLTGGGDEVWALNKLLHDRPLAQLIGFSLIFLITFYPLLKAWQLLKNKRKLLYFTGFFLIPVLVDHLVLLGIMNSLLANGLLATYWILGSPVLVTVWTLATLTIFLLTGKSIFTLGSHLITQPAS